MKLHSRRGIVLGMAAAAQLRAAKGEGMRVAVHVSTGAPVEGAVVILSQHWTVKPPRAGEADSPTVRAIGTTGKDGMAEFPLNQQARDRVIRGQRYTIEIRCLGFEPVTRVGVIAALGVVDFSIQTGSRVVW